MKKFMAIASVMLITGLAAGAASAAKLSGGIKGGLNLADVSGDDVDDTSMRTGFSGGAFLQADVNDQFGFRLEGLYVMKGAKETDDSLSVEVTTKLDYIEIPVLLVVNLTSGEKAGFNVYAGPTLGFNIGADIEAEGGQSLDIGEFVKGFEFGATAGVGLEYMMSSMSLTFDARYTLGATSIAEDDESTGESVDVKNRGIGLMVGLKFPLGGE